ncbi:MAG: hypothetical protein GXO26_09210 [Crenarchaeota archaeon]|nr:hypothetical protein [Thermoproteota archaeon]
MRIERKLLEKIAEELTKQYGKSETWKRRIIKRVLLNTVSRIVPGKLWIVRGVPELGDKYQHYEVYNKDGNYICTCYIHSWSSRRRPCTHVGAVILYERITSIVEPGPGFEPGK